jgi:hypothetical protein
MYESSAWYLKTVLQHTSRIWHKHKTEQNEGQPWWRKSDNKIGPGFFICLRIYVSYIHGMKFSSMATIHIHE